MKEGEYHHVITDEQIEAMNKASENQVDEFYRMLSEAPIGIILQGKDGKLEFLGEAKRIAIAGSTGEPHKI